MFTISLLGLGSDVVTRFLTQTRTCLNPKCNLYRFRAYSWITRYTSYLFGYIENMSMVRRAAKYSSCFYRPMQFDAFCWSMYLRACFSMHKFSHCEYSRNTGLLSGNYSEIHIWSRIHTYVNVESRDRTCPKFQSARVWFGFTLVWTGLKKWYKVTIT